MICLNITNKACARHLNRLKKKPRLTAGLLISEAITMRRRTEPIGMAPHCMARQKHLEGLMDPPRQGQAARPD